MACEQFKSRNENMATNASFQPILQQRHKIKSDDSNTRIFCHEEKVPRSSRQDTSTKSKTLEATWLRKIIDWAQLSIQLVKQSRRNRNFKSYRFPWQALKLTTSQYIYRTSNTVVYFTYEVPNFVGYYITCKEQFVVAMQLYKSSTDI